MVTVPITPGLAIACIILFKWFSLQGRIIVKSISPALQYDQMCFSSRIEDGWIYRSEISVSGVEKSAN